jgi:acyl-homoserine lactone synthase
VIHIIRTQRRAEFARAFDTMFADRKALFVDLLGWDVPVVDRRYEIDQFDDAHAIYVIALDTAGAHHGSLRLLPSIRPHILDTLFAPLCAAGVPKGSPIWEITRLCLPSRLGAAGRLAVRNRLISAMVDHALAAGIDRLTGVVEAGFRKEILAMGWFAEPLGPAMQIDGANLGAFAIHVAPDTPDRLRWTGIYQDGRCADEAGRAAA